MADAGDDPERYADKRDFRRTPEPRGGGGRSGGRRRGGPIFVVQQHDARSRHWDFRLEVGGVLRSWAVPKGPSTDPREKRLAVEVEDHPLAYADFEGVIPEGEYGAGAVIVWDRGRYENRSTDDDGAEVSLEQALRRGAAELWLEGEKIRGGYALVRAGLGGQPENWLLIKQDDEHADARRNPTSTEPHSVVSGRTTDDVRAADEG